MILAFFVSDRPGRGRQPIVVPGDAGTIYIRVVKARNQSDVVRALDEGVGLRHDEQFMNTHDLTPRRKVWVCKCGRAYMAGDRCNLTNCDNYGLTGRGLKGRKS